MMPATWFDGLCATCRDKYYAFAVRLGDVTTLLCEECCEEMETQVVVDEVRKVENRVKESEKWLRI